MARRGERTQRPRAACPVLEEPQEFDRVGVRVMERIRRDTVIRHTVDPSPYRCSYLAAELADELVKYTQRASLLNPTPYTTAIKGFAEFLDIYLPTVGCDPCDARLTGHKADLIEGHFQWEGHLRQQYGLRSDEPYRQAAAILALIHQRAQRDLDVPENLRRRSEGPPAYKKGQGQVLDEYSNAERLALQKAARDDVRALEERLARGRRLLKAGADPREEGWRILSNLVWAARHGLLTTGALLEHLPARFKFWPEPVREVVEQLKPGKERGVYAGMRAIHRLLFPTEMDLQPFRVLLLLGMADCTPEELVALRVPEVEFTDGAVRVTQTKMRATRIRADYHPGLRIAPGGQLAGQELRELEQQTTTEVFAGAGRWDVPGMFQRLLDVTALTRHAFPGSEDWMFLAVEAAKNRQFMRTRLAEWRAEYNRLGAWIALHVNDDGTPVMPISQPHHAGRLRKTVKTTRVAALGGTLTDLAADDHHIEVFRNHYAHGTTAHVLAARAVNRAQARVFRRITDKPLLVDTDVEQQLDRPEIAEAAGLTVEQATAIKAGEHDMGVTNCRDPYDSPHTPGGKACHVAPAMCMVCPNAVVFMSQLPRLLLLADHIERMRIALDPIRWSAVWGAQSAALTELCAECSAEQIQGARQAITDQQIALNLPLGMRTEYDR